MQSDRPDITVVVPVYHEQENIPAVIPRFIESLSSQRRSFELIVVNDGSRDSTGKLLDELAAREPRLRVIHLARNFGQTAALMAGFWAARTRSSSRSTVTARTSPTTSGCWWTGSPMDTTLSAAGGRTARTPGCARTLLGRPTG